MATFLSAPFNLALEDEIVATVIATNSLGSGTISSDSTGGATVKSAPQTPSSAPTLVSQSLTQIQVQWSQSSTTAETGDSTILSYNLVYDQGTNGGSFVSLVGEQPFSTDLTYVIGGLTANTSYQFKFRVYNKFGWSDFSPVLTVLTALVPDQPTAPTVVIQDTLNFRIAWSAPASNGGTAITAYKIVIRQNDDSTFSENTEYCDGSSSTIVANLYCDIPMTTLRAAPYSLEYDDKVFAKITAINGVGESPESNANTSSDTIQTEPQTPSSAPTVNSYSQTETSLTLAALTTAAQTGNSAILYY